MYIVATTAQWLQDRIDSVQARIVALEDAIAALGPNSTIMSYTLDTGQGKQTVVRQDLPRLTETLESLYNQHATMCARQTGSGVVIVRPGY